MLRLGVEALDRLWWARVIRRADVVDLDFLAASTGRRWTRSGAVRAYVRGGFRSGMTLNPLFLESMVSGQLSDAERVPALYAYLVNDAARIEVSPDWDAPAHAARFPVSLTAPGGPLGHAWREARRTGSVLLGRGDAATPVAWPLAAATAARRDRVGPDGPFETETVLVCTVDPAEDAGETLTTVAELVRRRRLDVVVAIDGDAGDLWAAATLLTLWLPRVRVVAARPGTVADVAAAAGAGATLVVRGPRARIGAEALAELAEAGAQRPTQPLWLAEDGTVASAGTISHDDRRFHLLAGHPAEDARALGPAIDHLALAGDTYARPVHGGTGSRTLTSIEVTAAAAARPPRSVGGPSTDVDALVAPLGLSVARWGAEGPRFVRARGAVALPDGTRVPRLRWALRTAAPAGPRGESWGDTHFARGIAAALRRLGQEVVIDAYAARRRPSGYLDDVVLALRGPHPIEPPSSGRSIVWIISHPDEITAAEIAGFNLAYAASTPWAAEASSRLARTIAPLLQCTDAHRFRPAGLPRGDELVFVGTARGIARPSVVEPLRAGIPISVYGPDWRGYIPATAIAGTGIRNEDLPARYESARAVLNDHWPAMQRSGFVSNRLYDVVAAGGRAISDDVAGIGELFGGAVLVYRTIPELLDLLRADLDAAFPDDEELARLSGLVRARDSFDARARTLLDAVLAL